MALLGTFISIILILNTANKIYMNSADNMVSTNNTMISTNNLSVNWDKRSADSIFRERTIRMGGLKESFNKHFPTRSCGDSILSTDDTSLKNKMKSYPVYAKYNEKDFITIKDSLCRDAFVINAKDGEFIQVAVFLDERTLAGFLNTWEMGGQDIEIRIGEPVQLFGGSGGRDY